MKIRENTFRYIGLMHYKNINKFPFEFMNCDKCHFKLKLFDFVPATHVLNEKKKTTTSYKAFKTDTTETRTIRFLKATASSQDIITRCIVLPLLMVIQCKKKKENSLTKNRVKM